MAGGLNPSTRHLRSFRQRRNAVLHSLNPSSVGSARAGTLCGWWRRRACATAELGPRRVAPVGAISPAWARSPRCRRLRQVAIRLAPRVRRLPDCGFRVRVGEGPLLDCVIAAIVSCIRCPRSPTKPVPRTTAPGFVSLDAIKAERRTAVKGFLRSGFQALVAAPRESAASYLFAGK
jgi:hypothetical protein